MPKTVKRVWKQKSPLPNKSSIALRFCLQTGQAASLGRPGLHVCMQTVSSQGFYRNVLQRNQRAGTSSMTQPTIRLTVNGRIHDVDAAPDTALLYVLRNDLELNGPKYGCGLGECGACAVLIDGVAARSCVIPVSGCVERDIVTLEGLGSRDLPDPVQEAFIAEQAAQCGYCLNGMIMSTKALLLRSASSLGDRNARSAALQFVPMRRSYRNHARGNAGGGRSRRGARLMAPGPADNRELRPGSLSVVRPAASGGKGAFETFVKITADGSVTAFNGHVDLGTGIRTALGQIVAEELDVSFARVVVVLGDTSRVPNQGATIASETIQITAVPLRKAAAQARHFLVARAAERLELAAKNLSIEDGLIRGRDNRSVSYGELIAGETIRLELADDVPVKAVCAYTIVGQSVPRIDLPAKATGKIVYVHDVRVPGMLHGRVVRPPYAGVDAGAFVGNSLIAVDESFGARYCGAGRGRHDRRFRRRHRRARGERSQGGGPAQSELEADADAARLKDVETALRANPSTPRTLIDKGDVDAAIAAAAKPMQRTYVWPYQMHGSIGPSCAVADYRDGASGCGPARKIRTFCAPTSRYCCGGRKPRSM